MFNFFIVTFPFVDAFADRSHVLTRALRRLVILQEIVQAIDTADQDYVDKSDQWNKEREKLERDVSTFEARCSELESELQPLRIEL